MDVMQLLEFNTQLTISNGALHTTHEELQFINSRYLVLSILFLYERKSCDAKIDTP